MIDITISGRQTPDRNVRLSFPATDEQVLEAYHKLTEGWPIGMHFPLTITKVDCDFALAKQYIQENSSLVEVNLLSYMLENIKMDSRDLFVRIADAKEPKNLSSFINELAALKSGWYEITDEAPGQADGEQIGNKFVRNFNTSPDVYRRHFVDDWLETERQQYEQHQSAPDASKNQFTHAKVREKSIIPFFEEVDRIAKAQGLTTRLSDASDEILDLYFEDKRIGQVDGYAGSMMYHDEIYAIIDKIHDARLQIPFENDEVREGCRLAALRERQSTGPETSQQIDGITL